MMMLGNGSRLLSTLQKIRVFPRYSFESTRDLLVYERLFNCVICRYKIIMQIQTYFEKNLQIILS